MRRADRFIALVCPILLVAACRDAMEPAAHVRPPAASLAPSAAVDPTLFYSTYLGGAAYDNGIAIAVDGAGNAYVTGLTSSVNFPTTAGAFQTTALAVGNAFVTKFNPTGSGLVYSTYLAGASCFCDNNSFGNGIAVDAPGNAYVTGVTKSSTFPTTGGAFQTAYGGGITDAFVTKLNPTGSGLVYSTYLGGGSDDQAQGIAVDPAGNAYVVGLTRSSNFPTTLGAFQTAYGGGNLDAFVTKLNPAGSGLAYSTYLGGSDDDRGIGIALDASGNAYVTGPTFSTNFPTTLGAFQTAYGGNGDVFVTKLNSLGTGLVYSTYLGGSGSDDGTGVAVDALGNAYVTGGTQSTNFPTLAAFQPTFGGVSDVFVAKLNPLGTGLLYSTYLGGSGDDFADGIALDALGSAYVTGRTASTNFPVTTGAPQTSFGGGVQDAFVTKLNPIGSGLVYSTYLGGSDGDVGQGIALDALPNPNAYVAGATSSINFPTTSGAFQTVYGGGPSDAFVTKIANILLPPGATSGKVTGGGTINVSGGIANFGFIVQAQTTTGLISGDLQYVNHASGAKVHSVAFNTLVIAGNTATFGGTCTKNGAQCTFTVNVTDNGEPGTNDSFVISVSGGAPEGSTLRSGNIQIHRTQ
jgi:hypothetical protein